MYVDRSHVNTFDLVMIVDFDGWDVFNSALYPGMVLEFVESDTSCVIIALTCSHPVQIVHWSLYSSDAIIVVGRPDDL